ncbi:MAG: PilZ domain-containing protein [Sphingomonas sp.]|uniref:PilZ domain-containing protein n=1 Tax=Sphingomonas sp. TaxID=28214 RepID=UPI0025E3F498|nr:PilZ domain-containing protein [Sphingomonas sp.]MBY0283718.1 PilZ domain-containing protein [Sphingomonas sp.]
MAGSMAAAYRDDRIVGRDEVHYRARAIGPDARPLALVIVNISALGLMARCEGEFREGDRLHITLPVIGVVVAQIRWSLGGRIGCELDRMIELADYYDLLAAMLKPR